MKSRVLDWISSAGTLELRLWPADARSCAHAGDCEADVRALLAVPYVARQVARWPAEKLRLELRDYGAWDDAELADDAMNRIRLLWIAAGDMADGGDE